MLANQLRTLTPKPAYLAYIQRPVGCPRVLHSHIPFTLLKRVLPIAYLTLTIPRFIQVIIWLIHSFESSNSHDGLKLWPAVTRR